MSLLSRGFDDLVLDNLVTILTAFSAAQVVLDPLVGFVAERDRLFAPSDDTLRTGPRVFLYSTGSVPRTQGGSRDHDESTCTIQADLYAGSVELSGGVGDKAAMARLYYLKEQVRAALFAKSATDLGFAPGIVGTKRWGRWQTTPQAQAASETWICSGSWTFEIDYSFEPEDLTMIDLEEINVTVKKSNNPTGPYSTLWAALYPNLNA